MLLLYTSPLPFLTQTISTVLLHLNLLVQLVPGPCLGEPTPSGGSQRWYLNNNRTELTSWSPDQSHNHSVQTTQYPDHTVLDHTVPRAHSTRPHSTQTTQYPDHTVPRPHSTQTTQYPDHTVPRPHSTQTTQY